MNGSSFPVFLWDGTPPTGSSDDLFEAVLAYNDANSGSSRIVIHSVVQPDHKKDAPVICRVNIGVYGNDINERRTVLNRFAEPKRCEMPRENDQPE